MTKSLFQKFWRILLMWPVKSQQSWLKNTEKEEEKLMTQKNIPKQQMSIKCELIRKISGLMSRFCKEVYQKRGIDMKKFDQSIEYLNDSQILEKIESIDQITGDQPRKFNENQIVKMISGYNKISNEVMEKISLEKFNNHIFIAIVEDEFWNKFEIELNEFISYSDYYVQNKQLEQDFNKLKNSYSSQSSMRRSLVEEQLVMIILLMAHFVMSGNIIPQTNNPIQPSQSNVDKFVNYSFFFSLSTNLEDTGHLEIIFPISFPGEYSSEFSCNYVCSNQGNKIKIFFNQLILSNTLIEVIIKGVKNPSISTGTSSFQLISYQGQNLIDSNTIFGTIGITTQVKELISSNVNPKNTDNKAGQTQLYSFSLKVPEKIDYQIEIHFRIPLDTFTVTNFPYCSSYEINEFKLEGDLACSYSDSLIKVTGIEGIIPSESFIGINIRMVNPSISQVTSTFDFFIFKFRTKNAVFEKRLVEGVVVSPGEFQQVSLHPINRNVNISKSLQLWLELTFRPQNKIPENSKIIIETPLGMTIPFSHSVEGLQWFYYIKEGLQSVLGQNIMINHFPSTSGDKFEISNFQPLNDSKIIKFHFFAKVPFNQGLTASCTIQSIDQNGDQIDFKGKDANIEVQEIDIPESTSLTSSHTTADNQTQITLTVKIIPSKNIPQKAVFTLLIDSRFQVNTMVPEYCQLFNSSSGLYDDSETCSTLDNTITFYFLSELNLGVEYTFVIKNLITSPRYSSYFHFLFQISQENNIYQQWEDLIFFSPLALNQITAETYPKYKNQKSLMDIEFKSPYTIEQSPVVKDETFIYSFLVIRFSGTSIVQSDMGIGIALGKTQQIQCRTILGLMPIEGLQISCFMTSQSEPIILITNYQSVNKDKMTKILIPNIFNPNGTWKLTVSFILHINRRYLVLLQSDFNLTTNIALPNGLLSNLTNDGEVFYQVSNKKFGKFFDITFPVSDSTQIDNNSKILIQLPSFGSGFLVDQNYLACQIMNVYFKCYGFPEIDWVYILIDQQLNPHPQNSFITIKNLKWPLFRLQGTPNTKNQWRFISQSNQINKIMHYPVFPRTLTNELTKVQIKSSKRQQGNVNVDILFEIVSPQEIPEQSQLTITFPPYYNLLSPDFPIKIEMIQKNTNVTSTVNNDNIILNNLPIIYEDQSFTFAVRGLRNPLTANPLQEWDLNFSINGNPIAFKNNFLNFKMLGTHTIKQAFLKQISLFPLNRGLRAQYEIKFSLSSNLPIGSQILIEFPEQYNNLPNEFSCEISGALHYYDNCERIGQIFIISLSSEYYSGDLTVFLDNIYNPDVDQVENMKISTKYDQQIIHQVPQENKFITFTEQPTQLMVEQFEQSLFTESIPCNFFLTIRPKNTITQNHQIIIQFPRTFDNFLSSSLKVEISGVVSEPFQYQVKRRAVIIDKFQVDSEESVVVVKFFEVINPQWNQVDDKGYIQVGIMQEMSYGEYIENGSLVKIVNKSSVMSLANFKSENQLSRLSTNISLNLLTPLNSFERLLIRFPDEFESSKDIIEFFINGFQVDYENHYNFFELKNSQSFSEIFLEIKNLINPQEEKECENFKFYIKDQQDNTIKRSVYPNLNLLTFAYTFPGPLFTLNNDKPIIIEKDSFSDFLPLKLSKICALDLSIQIKKNQTVSMLPEILEFKIGEIEKYLRISVSSSYINDFIWIEWEIKGDRVPPFYTPLRRTLLKLTQKENIPLLVQDINDIPLNGSSLAVKINTIFAPFTGIQLRLGQTNQEQVRLNTTSLYFEKGQNEAYFELQSLREDSQGLVNGEIILEMGGVNQKIFNLQKNVLEYKVVANQENEPQILELKLGEVFKTKAEFLVVTNQLSTLYYFNCLKGTPQPLFEELINKEEQPSSVRPQRGIVHIGKNLTGKILINNLEAQIRYTLFVYLINRSQVRSQNPRMIQYETISRDRPLQVQISFLKNYINFAEKSLIFQHLAFLMSLRDSKVKETYYRQKIDYSEQSDSNTFKVKFDILPDSFSDVYPSPLTLMQELILEKQKIREKFSTFDLNYKIITHEFQQEQIFFTAPPQLIFKSFSEFQFQVKFSNIGEAYVVAIKKYEAFQKPNSFQISQKLDSTNLSVISAQVLITQRQENFILKIENLQPDTDYVMYFTCGAYNPDQPDLIEDGQVVTVEASTLKKKEEDFLNINSVFLMKVVFLLLI